MTTPEWPKPGIYGALVGAAFVGIFGFSWGGWMTASSAEEMANNMAQEEVIAALVPVCLDMSRTDNQRVAKVATIRQATSFKRSVAVMETGRPTMTGKEGPNRDMAQACVDGLELEESS